MADWTYEQKVRMRDEAIVLDTQIPHFSFTIRQNDILVSGYHLSSANKYYQLCVFVNSSFPYQMPGLYVTDPSPLIGYGGKAIYKYETSHNMHTWKSDWNNYVKICHSKSEYWNAKNTIVSVLLKGFLWIEAFEAHLRTGNTINTYSLSL